MIEAMEVVEVLSWDISKLSSGYGDIAISIHSTLDYCCYSTLVVLQRHFDESARILNEERVCRVWIANAHIG